MLRHYRFRDKEQAIKNNTIRIDRTKNIPERKIGWYVHLDKISKQKYYESLDHKLLFQYNEDNNWSRDQKLQPFVDTSHKKRDELFSKDGKSFEQPLTIPERLALLKEREIKINELQKKIDDLESLTKHEPFKTESPTIDAYNELNTKPFLIITGMHRSGTSFLARALNLADMTELYEKLGKKGEARKLEGRAKGIRSRSE